MRHSVNFLKRVKLVCIRSFHSLRPNVVSRKVTQVFPSYQDKFDKWINKEKSFHRFHSSFFSFGFYPWQSNNIFLPTGIKLVSRQILPQLYKNYKNFTTKNCLYSSILSTYTFEKKHWNNSQLLPNLKAKFCILSVQFKFSDLYHHHHVALPALIFQPSK